MVGTADQLGVASRVERGEGARAAQGRHAAGVPELEELDGPLDVGEAAAAELEVGVRVGAPRQPLAFHPSLDPLDLRHVRLRDALRRIAQRVDERGEPVTHGLVADDGVGAEQRLGLPHLRPLAVVGGVRRERAHERALLALRPEAGVDDEGGIGAGREQELPQLVRDGMGVRRRLLAVGAVQRHVHEHHVGVAAVRQLEPAVATHRDDRHPRRRAVEPTLGADAPLGDVERRLQGGVGEPRQRGPDRGDVGLAEQLADGDPEQLAPPDGTDRPDGLRRIVPDDRRTRASARRRPPTRAASGPRRASARPRARARSGRSRSARSRAAGRAARPPDPRRGAS